jgi:hypothetical protein
MDSFISVDIWQADFIWSSLYSPFSPDSGQGNNYDDLKVVKRFDLFDYLKMLVKLLPFGQIWRFPIGAPEDYAE